MIQPSDKNSVSQLVGGRLLARNTVINLLGRIAPLLVAVIAIPLLIEGLGVSRFGVLTLAWMLVGYFSLFDLGIGRALTKMVAEKLGSGEEQDLPVVIWTSLILMFGFGVLGAGVVLAITPWLVYTILKIPPTLQTESLHAFYILAAAIPIVITSVGLRGVLEARQQFGLINLVRIGLGLFTYLGPLLALAFSNSLIAVVVVLVIGRVLAWWLHLTFCVRAVPALRRRLDFDRQQILPILRFGGWVTVSNTISPVMQYMDRFIIGALVSITAVAYYVTPYEVVTKLLVVPAALVGVLFPAFSTTFVSDREQTVEIFQRSMRFLYLILFPVVLLIVSLARPGLQLWLGSEFVANSTLVLQILAIGVFINSLGYLPFTLLQSIGRPDATAKLHMVEVPFYLFLLWFLIQTHDIVGAAIAWLARVLVDLIALLFMVRRILPSQRIDFLRLGCLFGTASLALALALLPMSLQIQGLYTSGVLIAFLALGWFVILAPDERLILQNAMNLSRLSK